MHVHVLMRGMCPARSLRACVNLKVPVLVLVVVLVRSLVFESELASAPALGKPWLCCLSLCLIQRTTRGLLR